MSASSDLGLLRRLIAYELDHAREVSELVEPIAGGTLVLNPALESIWSANYIELGAAPGTAGEPAGLADRLLGDRGYRHRRVVPIEPAESERLAPGFAELGWEVSRSVYMVLSRPPLRTGAPAVEVSAAETQGIRRAVRSRRDDMTPESIEEMLAWDARLDEGGAARWFAAFSGGQPASSCVLYERGGIAQVETVTTVPGAEGRGLASGVVLAAAEESRAAGHQLTFIVADADDWPWRLYERLGFEPVGESCAYLRKPPSPSG